MAKDKKTKEMEEDTIEINISKKDLKKIKKSEE